MTNAATVQAIFTNIEAIILAQGYKVEDLSTNADITTPFAQVFYSGEEFDNEFGQIPEYNDIKMLIRLQFNSKTPALSKALQIVAVHKMRDSITVATINVSDLSSSKLCTFVSHTGADVAYESPITIIDYRLTIQYREL